jgi:hypothetical protein
MINNQRNRSNLSLGLPNDSPDSAYINDIVELTKSFFINKRGVSPAFLYEKDGEIQLIKVPEHLLDNDKGKDDLSDLMTTAVNTFNPESYCLICEAWAYTMDDFASKEEAVEAFVNFKKGIPSDKITKKEVVTFAFTKVNTDKTLDRWVGNMPIKRDSEDMISGFDDIIWIKDEGDKKLEGRLFTN